MTKSARVFGRSLLLALAISMSLESPAYADGLRAAPRDDYGRLVFDWDQPIRYAADVVAGQLIVQFERPFTGDVAAASQSLRAFVLSGQVSADRRTATFPLRANVTMRTFTVGNAVVVDLTGPQTAQSAAPAAAAPTPLLRPGTTARGTATAPAAPTGPAAQARSTQPRPQAPPAGSIPVRTGTHPDYFRIVFDWPSPTTFQVERRGDRAAIVFDRTAAIDGAGLARRLPAANAGVTIAQEGDKTVVSIPVPAASNVRSFTNGNSVVFDLMGAPGAKNTGCFFCLTSLPSLFLAALMPR